MLSIHDREEIIKEAVNRFLCWKLPDKFYPDAGIKFEPFPEQSPSSILWPVGTNLLTAEQAKEMFEHCLGELL